ncbi:uncharacterized protein BX664DRAFT_277758 [Halteromyces radiatus]|uniref:uncharacterized protein n=1 Tax=Halteromyces radiatus TaxID=101107 RepID=UPI00222046ED|nr:uncharacterized protein BX664DRAFT_277758 [Halteromyces radiatus]KAI8093063.1 hypothetical protein BX664DRAFT_277758 [Halteromyces radiatus]
MKVENNLFIVSGGASGLGRQTVCSLVNKGAYVGIIDINAEASLALVEQLDEKYVHFPGSVDVTSEEQVEQAIQEIKIKFQIIPLVGAVLCSGVLMPPSHIEGYGPKSQLTSYQQFKHIVDINLLGTYNVIQKISNILIQNQPLNEDGERGVIITVSSITGLDGSLVGYGTSKAGIAGLTLPLARELAIFGIRSMCIAPGPFETPISTTAGDMKAPPCLFPSRHGHPTEFADTVIHLITSSMLNGSIIRLDGGLRI